MSATKRECLDQTQELHEGFNISCKRCNSTAIIVVIEDTSYDRSVCLQCTKCRYIIGLYVDDSQEYAE